MRVGPQAAIRWRRMPDFLKWAIGAAVLVLLGWLGVHGAQGPFSAARVEQKLTRAAEARLRAEGHAWAEVEARGQMLALSGAAPSEAARDAAVRTARGAAGPGGFAAGGVVRVVADGVDVGPPAGRPFDWTARFDEGGLTLSGEGPASEAPRLLVRARAEQLFPAPIEDATEAAPGEPANWADTVTRALEALAELTSGRVRIEGETLTLMGEAASREAARAARARLSQIEGVRIDAVEIDIVGPAALELETASAPEAPEPIPADVCQDAFDAFTADGFLQFETGSAELQRASFEALERLVDTARRCEGARIVVEGHTDDRGEAAMNMELSLARAEAVADFLISRGLAQERVAARGFGETQPIADNDTADGRAANRRITFRIVE